MKKLKTKDKLLAGHFAGHSNTKVDLTKGHWVDGVVEVPKSKGKVTYTWKYPTRRQIWFRRHENLLYAIGGVIVAGLFMSAYLYFGGKL